MLFSKASVSISLFAQASLALVAQPVQLTSRALGEVYSDYEDISVTGIPGATNNAPLIFYNQLTYSAFIVVHRTGPANALIAPDGMQAAIGGNQSFLSAQYTGSPVASFKPNFASFGCYLSTNTAVAAAVSCTIQVTAYKPDGTLYADKAGCAFDGGRTLDQCTFPTTWTTVGKLSFQVIAAEILDTVGPALRELLGGLTGRIGTVGFLLDDFDSIYTCIPGKTNSVVAPALCG